MTAYLIVCMFLIAAGMYFGQLGGLIAALMASALLAPIWYITFLVFHSDDPPEPYPTNYFCDQYHPHCQEH